MRKGKQRGKQNAPDSFRNLLAEQTLKKFSPYIDQKVNQVVQVVLGNQLENLYTRLLATEEILMEEVDGLTKDVLARRVALIQDRSAGFEPADEVQEGDRVRIEIRTKTKDQDEFQGSSRLLVENAGSGNTLGKQIEAILPGMKEGETREVKFGNEDDMTASVTLSMVSRAVKVEKPDALEEAVAEASAEENNDSNAE